MTDPAHQVDEIDGGSDHAAPVITPDSGGMGQGPVVGFNGIGHPLWIHKTFYCILIGFMMGDVYIGFTVIY